MSDNGQRFDDRWYPEPTDGPGQRPVEPGYPEAETRREPGRGLEPWRGGDAQRPRFEPPQVPQGRDARQAQDPRYAQQPQQAQYPQQEQGWDPQRSQDGRGASGAWQPHGPQQPPRSRQEQAAWQAPERGSDGDRGYSARPDAGPDYGADRDGDFDRAGNRIFRAQNVYPTYSEPPVEHQYSEYRPHGHDRRRRGRMRTPVIAGGSVALVVVLGMVAYFAMDGSPISSKPTAAQASPSPSHTGFQPSAIDPADAAQQTATAFLNAWQSGDLQKAADYTDNSTAAMAALTAYKSGLDLSALSLTVQKSASTNNSADPSSSVDSTGLTSLSGLSDAASTSASSSATASSKASSSASSASGSSTSSAPPPGTVDFAATATVGMTGSTATAAWKYSSSLVAYQTPGGWLVRWSPTDLAPNLAAGESLSVVAVKPGSDKVTDASGNNLAGSSQSALVNIAAALRATAPTGSGTPGMAVVLTNSSGTPIKGTQAVVLKAVNAATTKTTISPTAEEIAAHAVAMEPRSSMVILRPSTGAILAVANSAGLPDSALNATLAPGSTFKIITSTALLYNNDVSLYTPVSCPATFTVQGVTFHNATNSKGAEESLPAGTPFITDFAQSCNNAFTQWYPKLEGGKLASVASGYYGLNQKWDLGFGPYSYFGMPTDASGAELAQEDFGQGQVWASPLAMASVAGTVGTDQFHQPYLVSGGKPVTASALPSSTDAELKTLMHQVTVNGTAAGVFSGLGTVYAKTGTAEAASNKDGNTNGWIVVYDPSLDLAVGVVVVDAGMGAATAGPEAAYALRNM